MTFRIEILPIVVARALKKIRDRRISISSTSNVLVSFLLSLRVFNISKAPTMARSKSLGDYLRQFINSPFIFIYQLIQYVLSYILSPTPPPPNVQLGRPKVAIIGAGLTGISSAAHCVGHGFDVTIFEAGSRNNVGGIWAKVNNSSGLQIHSLMYR